ncbi:hypothetical protein FA15DRAFT_670855 [Coprinopsis marcescibilis]|uniref:Uncharacterized protein n=1 Tax=Coprinopsis marcescibilis TaxID=230819 RepID=A0A5C3L4I4_COPMA|nr:hypothetical protein FA15DRAFT_670855 [Coprinopsis marcescibilis]
MLKRQRQASPVPASSSSIPFVHHDTPDDFLASRDLKRRRTEPPVLDGTSRGWEVAPGDEEEDYEPSEYDQHTVQAAQTDEYKSTNNLLRELHILQQHRLLFTEIPSKQAAPLVPSPHVHALSSDRLLGKVHFNGNSEPQHLWKNDHSNPGPDTLRNAEESIIVHERYGGTNRLLKDLFLSRRREIEVPISNDRQQS